MQGCVCVLPVPAPLLAQGATHAVARNEVSRCVHTCRLIRRLFVAFVLCAHADLQAGPCMCTARPGEGGLPLYAWRTSSGSWVVIGTSEEGDGGSACG